MLFAGNYHPWSIAIASSGNDVPDSDDITDSSCFANWYLSDYGGNGSYRYLLFPYGLTSSLISSNNNINTSLYFVRNGIIYPIEGCLNDTCTLFLDV